MIFMSIEMLSCSVTCNDNIILWTFIHIIAPRSGEAEECVGGDVRLSGGVHNSPSGRVEVCLNGVWGSVCDRSGHWQSLSHNVATVCRQLGLPTDGELIVRVFIIVATILSMIGGYVTSLFGGGTGPVFLDEVQCVGTENEILSCLNAGIGHHKCGEGLEAHKFDVGIICAGIRL